MAPKIDPLMNFFPGVTLESELIIQLKFKLLIACIDNFYYNSIMNKIHNGGCLCGKSRFETYNKPDANIVCHCRYCQLRTGSAFGISIYFKKDNLKIESGDLKKYINTTENGNNFETNFCTNCGTSLFWTLSHMKDLIGVAGGTYDPPSFWFDIQREIFKRTKANL